MFSVNKHSACAAIFLVAVVLLLSACSSVGGLLVCLAGGCQSNQEIAAAIPWEPATLSLQNCPNISGRYRGASTKGVLLMQMFPQGSDIFRAIQVKIEDNTSAAKMSFRESLDFDKNTDIYIEQSDEELVVTRKDDAKGLYRRLTINLNSSMTCCRAINPYRDGRLTIDLNSSMIGCDGGDIVIRETYRTGGGEGISGGAMTAIETRFRKLADNSLIALIHERNWRTDPALGLTDALREGKNKATFLGAP